MPTIIFRLDMRLHMIKKVKMDPNRSSIKDEVYSLDLIVVRFILGVQHGI